MALIEVNGETLGYDRAGSGERLLLIHSLGTAAWMWRAEIARWSGRFDVIAVDARGHGRSSNRGGFTVRDVAADLAGVLRALGEGPARVVAISMGGPIAAHLTDLAPELVSRLVICDSFADQGAAGATRAAAIAETVAQKGMEAYARAYAADTLVEDDPTHVAELVASIAGMTPADYVQAAGSVFTANVVELYRQIRVPTRVVVGSRDNRTPPKLSQEIAALVPGADYVEVEGARHLANLDRPAGFHAAVEPFLLAD